MHHVLYRAVPVNPFTEQLEEGVIRVCFTDHAHVKILTECLA